MCAVIGYERNELPCNLPDDQTNRQLRPCSSKNIMRAVATEVGGDLLDTVAAGRHLIKQTHTLSHTHTDTHKYAWQCRFKTVQTVLLPTST